MRVLIRSTDPVLLSYVESLLTSAGFTPERLDSGISMIGGGIGALPQRIMLPDDQIAQARHLLSEADLAHEIAKDDIR